MLLEVKDLVAGYDGSRVLGGVNLSIDTGETVALLGRNGVGKTTLVESIMGLVRPRSGEVRVNGVNLARKTPNHLVRAGVGIVPQGRRIFPSLTVEEHLQISVRKGGDWTVASVMDLMPRLGERKNNLGSQLSGGEQQMVAIGRALVGNPKLLLLDEPSDGLAPAVVNQVGEVLTQLATTGLAILIVEQDLRLAFDVAQRVMVMQKGEIVHQATTHDFRHDGERAQAMLGVG